MAFDDAIAAASLAVITSLGAPVTYRQKGGGDPVETHAVIERDVALIGGGGEMVERVTVADLLVAHVRSPARGDVVSDGARAWTVQEVESNDGAVVRVRLR